MGAPGWEGASQVSMGLVVTLQLHEQMRIVCGHEILIINCSRRSGHCRGFSKRISSFLIDLMSQ